MIKVAVVTGGSSGIGKFICEALAAKGVTVYSLSRRGCGAQNTTHIACDITEPEAVKQAFRHIFDKHERIDIVINNAGTGISGAIEFTAPEEIRELMNVNFYGAVNVIREVVPLMRKCKGGRIINVSSVAAPVAIPFQAYYSVSKAAINSLTLSLRNELKPFGISVCAVMPGDTRTEFTAARRKNNSGDEVYCKKISRSVSSMEKDEQNGMSAEKAGSFICKTALKKRVKPLYAIGFWYKAAVVLMKILPVSLANRIIGLIYA